jgi:hypothetical protein
MPVGTMHWRRATDRTYGTREPVTNGQSQAPEGKGLVVLLSSISKEILEKLAAFLLADARGDQAAMV